MVQRYKKYRNKTKSFFFFCLFLQELVPLPIKILFLYIKTSLMKAKIIHPTEQYRNKLISYMHQIHPTYTDAFIQYDVDEAIGNKDFETKSLIVVNESDEIVGCHFYFNTKAWINGEERNALWGHNTYLNKEYRRIVGLDMMLEMATIKNGFGYGLTDINYKIQKLIKGNIFINGLRKYHKANIWFAWGMLLRSLRTKIQIPKSLPSYINYGKEKFTLCQNVNEIYVPNGGFWYKDICEIDFIRDQEFLNKRFFYNPVNKYYIYTNQNRNCYFAIRPILHQGIMSIQVADVRYLHTQPEHAKTIFRTIEKICSRLHAGSLLFTTSDRVIKTLYDKDRLCKSYPVAFICSKKNVSSTNANIIINAADSDDEYYQ